MSNVDEVDYESLKNGCLCETYVQNGFCEQQIEQNCHYVHGDFCVECQQYALHPFNENLRLQHEINCLFDKLTQKLSNHTINEINQSIQCIENNLLNDEIYDELVSTSICPQYEQNGRCNEQENYNCQLIHGELCDICKRYSLHPFCELKRSEHVKQCIEDFENNRTCSICFEIIGRIPDCDNPSTSHQIVRSFGRLENCSHIFCWNCIQTWRTTSNSRKCPVCQIPSESIVKTNN